MRFPTGIVVLISMALATSATSATAGPRGTAAARRAAALEREARTLVERHFTALAAGDQDALDAIWSPTATVTTERGGKAIRVVSIADAMPIWLAARGGFTGRVKKVRVEKDGLVIYAFVTWNGVRYSDQLVVRRDAQGVLRIVAKTTFPIDRERAGRSGYGG